jgi:hypothetical protein
METGKWVLTSFENVQKANMECEDSERNMWRKRLERCKGPMGASQLLRNVQN